MHVHLLYEYCLINPGRGLFPLVRTINSTVHPRVPIPTQTALDIPLTAM